MIATGVLFVCVCFRHLTTVLKRSEQIEVEKTHAGLLKKDYFGGKKSSFSSFHLTGKWNHELKMSCFLFRRTRITKGFRLLCLRLVIPMLLTKAPLVPELC